MAASAIAPPRRDDHMIILSQPRRLGHDATDPVHHARDLVTRRDGRRDIGISAEVPIRELHVGAAYAASLDLDENLVGLNVGNRDVLEDEGLVVLEQARRFHLCSPGGD